MNSEEYNPDSVVTADKSVPPAFSQLKELREYITSVNDLDSHPIVEAFYKQMWDDFIIGLPNITLASSGDLCKKKHTAGPDHWVMCVKV